MVAVLIDRFAIQVDAFVVAALFRVTETVAAFTLKEIVHGGRSPFLLREAGTALVALGTAGVVLAFAVEFERRLRVEDVADVRVTVTDAASADVHVLQ